MLNGYNSNISNCISLNDCKIMGLKSHDCHVLILLLPVALRELLPKGLRNTIMRLCSMFNTLYQWVIDREIGRDWTQNLLKPYAFLRGFSSFIL